MNLPINQLPGIPSLMADYLDHYEKVAGFFGGNFRDPHRIVAKSQEVRSRILPAESVASLLREQNLNFGCTSETLKNIESLRQRKALAVVTGQQTGGFSGPLLTIYKALTAIKLAVLYKW